MRRSVLSKAAHDAGLSEWTATTAYKFKIATTTGLYDFATSSLLTLDASGKLGIGTTSPAATLNIVDTGQGIFDDAYGAGGGFTARAALGTVSSPSALTANSIMATYGARGYGATGFSATSRASMKMYAAENWSDTAQGAYLTFYTTPTASAVSVERLRIDASGNVGIGTRNSGRHARCRRQYSIHRRYYRRVG